MYPRRLNKIEKKLIQLGRWRGDMLLFQPRDAMHFVDLCAAEGTKIHGYDVFTIDGKYIQIDSWRSKDYSGGPDFIADVEPTCQQARKDIAKLMQDDVWLEFVIEAVEDID